MVVWLIEKMGRVISEGNMHENALSREQNRTGQKKQRSKARLGFLNPYYVCLLLLHGQIPSYFPSHQFMDMSWPLHNWHLGKSGSILIECMDGGLSNNPIKPSDVAGHCTCPKLRPGFSIVCPAFLPCSSSTLILCTVSFSLLVVLLCHSQFLLCLLPSLFLCVNTLFLAKLWAYPQSLGEIHFPQRSLTTTFHVHLPSVTSL